MKKHIQSAALKAAFPMTIPVMAGYIFLGISYGVLSRTNGFPIWLPVVTALIIYTGSMEFLMVSILASAFHPMAAFVTTLMVGSRHLFYGLSMLHKYHGTGRKKFYLIYTTSDETFVVNYTAKIPAHVDKGWFYLSKVLGPAVFGLQVIYCFRNISISGGQHGIPELIATIAIYFLYRWKENMILPIAGGTILYMVLLHLSSV